MNTKKKKTYRQRPVRQTRPAWTPFTQSIPVSGELRPGETMYYNSRYTVIMETLMPKEEENLTMVHLSIRDNERSTRHDWRDYQRIKNELVGEEYEAVELYPAESRLLDTSNQYHLWCVLSETWRFPFGWTKRLVAEGDYKNGAVQRPFEDKPVGLLTEEQMDEMARKAGIY